MTIEHQPKIPDREPSTVPTFYMVWHRTHWLTPVIQEVRAVLLRHKYRVAEVHGGNKLITTVSASIILDDGEVDSLSLDVGDQLYLVHKDSDTFKVVFYA